MTISDGIKLQGRPAEIPDCSRDSLPQFFLEMGYKIGAEIGVYKGAYTEKLCRAGLKIYAIDPWQAHEDYEEKGSKHQERHDFLYDHAQRALAMHPNCTIIRKTSINAVKDFEDNSLDFVYIDGNHQLKFVIEDIVEWSRKVKKGGIISGHDYIYTNPRSQIGICHVIYAVNAFTAAYKIGDWYLLGRKESKPGEVRDKFRSWMFFNKPLEYKK